MDRSSYFKKPRFSLAEKYALAGLLMAFLALLFSGCESETNVPAGTPQKPRQQVSVKETVTSPAQKAAQTPDAGGTTPGLALNDDLYLGNPIVAQNITAWPVYSRSDHPLVEKFITLDQAQEQKKAVIREVGASTDSPSGPSSRGQRPRQRNASGEPQRQSEQGSQVRTQTRQGVSGTVNTLMIDNKGDTAILILAGTLVKGGKQDRQIAQDFIIPPGTSVPVDAFCVEQGRWDARREGKSTAGYFKAQKALASKSVRDSAQFKGSQQEVWNNVASTNTLLGKSPQSGTYMAGLEETDKNALKRRKYFSEILTESLKKLEVKAKHPVGVAYAVDGKVKMVRTFSHPKILKIHQESLINTIAMEGDMAQRKALVKKENIFEGPAPNKQVAALVQAAEKEKEKIVKTRAGNDNGFRKNKSVWNANVYSKDGNDKVYSPSKSWTVAE